MNPVFLSGGTEADLALDKHEGLKSVPLLRRMTSLQKAVMTALVKALDTHAHVLESLRLAEAPIYFTSAYGECSAMFRVTQSIEADSLPVSPKDFQHSVLNAALAYFTMQLGSHQAGFALSGGYESADITLHLAARRIGAGLDTGAIVIHAHENGSLTHENAWAEMLLLTSDRRAESTHILSSVASDAGGLVMADEFIKEEGNFLELANEEGVAWLLKDGRPFLKRKLRTSFGTEYQTSWQELPDDYRG